MSTPSKKSPLGWLGLPALLACASPPPAPRALAPDPPASSTRSEPPPEPTAGHATYSPPSPSAPPPASATPGPLPAPVSYLTWTQALAVPGLALAAGERRLAVLTGPDPTRPTGVQLFDGGRWRDLPFGRLVAPDPASDHLEVYFGRDDRPRIMGYRERAGRLSQRYYRWKGNWRDRAGEIGRLDGDPPAALFGVLGHADPEVVCKQGDICIIKRRTGWTMVPVPSQLHRVRIADGRAYAVAAGSALTLGTGDDAWAPLTPAVPWTETPSALAVVGTTVWVAAGTSVYRGSAARWRSTPSIVGAARALWAGADDDVWVVGENGVGHHDGRGWRRLAEPVGPQSAVTGHRGDVWVAGPNGVWVGTPYTLDHNR